MNHDRINATLARRIATVRQDRNAAHAAGFSPESFSRWLACSRRANALRAALLDRLSEAASNPPQPKAA